MADTIRPTAALTAAHGAPVAAGALQETTYLHSGEFLPEKSMQLRCPFERNDDVRRLRHIRSGRWANLHDPFRQTRASF